MTQFIRFATLVTWIVLCLTVAATAQNGIVSIESVTNTTPTGQLIPGKTHVVSINYDYRAVISENAWAGANAFEVYSPDGADWGYLLGTPGPSIAAPRPEGHGDLLTHRTHYNYDGATWTATDYIFGGVDPAMGGVAGGFRFATDGGMGNEGGTSGVTNGIAVILEFRSNVADVGLTVCVDTCTAISAWEWAAGSDQDFPVWDNGLGIGGPRCMEIADCSIGEDTDSDGWADHCDLCPGHDDNLDIDGDGMPDDCDSSPAPAEFGLDHVEGLVSTDVLASDRPIRFVFQATVNDRTVKAMILGLELSSPDGAQWGAIEFATVPDFASLTNGATASMDSYGPADGVSPDTIRILTGLFEPVMLPVGFSDQLFYISTTFDASQAGLTFCIDRVYDFSLWKWLLSDGWEIAPAWKGPHCFTISPECCIGRVGDANCSGDDEPTIGDISYMIDRKFIDTGEPQWCCILEADINGSGFGNPTDSDITIGDISILIDYLFMTGPELGLPNCW